MPAVDGCCYSVYVVYFKRDLREHTDWKLENNCPFSWELQILRNCAIWIIFNNTCCIIKAQTIPCALVSMKCILNSCVKSRVRSYGFGHMGHSLVHLLYKTDEAFLRNKHKWVGGHRKNQTAYSKRVFLLLCLKMYKYIWMKPLRFRFRSCCNNDHITYQSIAIPWNLV